MKKFLIFLILASFQLSAQTWRVETVEKGTSALGDYTSISVDASNNAHIVYRQVGVDIRYAAWYGGQWSFESLPLDASGRWTVNICLEHYNAVAHVSYADNTNGVINHYYRVVSAVTGPWTVEKVDTLTGDMTRIRVGTDNSIHMIYTDKNTKDLKYAVAVGGAWTLSTITTNVSTQFIGLSLDSKNRPNVVFKDNTTSHPNFAIKTGGSWILKEINTDAISSTGMPGLGIDASDVVHILYKSGNYLKHAQGTYAVLTGATPITASNIDGAAGLNVGSYSAVCNDTGGNLHVAYRDDTNKALKYAELLNGDTKWTLATIDSGAGDDVGSFCDIAVGNNGYPQISYYDATATTLKAARLIPPPPLVTTGSVKLINNVFNPNKGGTMNIQYTISNDGTPVIKIYDVKGNLIKNINTDALVAGSYFAIWDGNDSSGKQVPAGVYYIMMNYNSTRTTKKAVVVR